MKTATITVSADGSWARIPLSIALPARNGGASAAAVAMTSATSISTTWSRYGPQQPEHPAHLARTLVLAAEQAPHVAQHQQRPGEAPRLVGLVLRLLGDVGALRLGVALGDRVDLALGLAVARAAVAVAPRAHSRASSSRSSASFCRKSTSSQPNSAISAYSGQRSSSSSCWPASTIRPAVHDHDLVGERDRREPVRDHERRPALHHLAQPALYRRLGARVDGGRGVVEDQDPRVRDQRSRDRDALALAARERHPALADDRVVAVGQPRDEVVRLGSPRGLLDLVLRRVRAARRRCSPPPWPRTGSSRRRRRRPSAAATRRRRSARRRRRPATAPSLGS